MAVNRGKQFEDIVKESFERVHNVSIDRLHDQTTGFKGSTNICDFIVYQKPFQYYIECKSIHGNTLSIHSIPKKDKNGVLHGFFGNITDTQWEGLLEKSKIYGCVAGIMCWWVDKDVTLFIDIRLLQLLREGGYKSIRYDLDDSLVISVPGTKKRVFFDYDMKYFLDRMEIAYAGKH